MEFQMELEVDNPEELVDRLRWVIEEVEAGYFSSMNNGWELHGEPKYEED